MIPGCPSTILNINDTSMKPIMPEASNKQAAKRRNRYDSSIDSVNRGTLKKNLPLGSFFNILQ